MEFAEAKEIDAKIIAMSATRARGNLLLKESDTGLDYPQIEELIFSQSKYSICLSCAFDSQRIGSTWQLKFFALQESRQ